MTRDRLLERLQKQELEEPVARRLTELERDDRSRDKIQRRVRYAWWQYQCWRRKVDPHNRMDPLERIVAYGRQIGEIDA